MVKYIEANVNKDMIKDLLNGREFDKLRALCVHEEHYNSAGKRQPQMGMVLFHMQDLNFELVSHEYCHAATYYLEDMKADFSILYTDKDLNERMATIQGNLNGQFWNFYVDNDKILEK